MDILYRVRVYDMCQSVLDAVDILYRVRAYDMYQSVP